MYSEKSLSMEDRYNLSIARKLLPAKLWSVFLFQGAISIWSTG